MSYDLVIKNGTVVDGSGLPRYRADVGVRHGRIVTSGRIRERASGRIAKATNFGGSVCPSAIRTYVMRGRAFGRSATEDDLRAMERQVRDAIRAGALGFTTSRSPAHETPEGRYVASRLASWDEVRRL